MTGPVVAPAYRAFPRCVYKDGAMSLVHDPSEQAAKLADGWSLTPYPPAPEVTQESADVVPDEVPAEPTIPTAPKKRGRPPKRPPAQE